MKTVRTTSRHYDVTGIGSGRTMRIIVLWKLMGIGGLGGHQGLAALLRLWLRHRFGRAVTVVTVMHEQRWLAFLRGFRQRRAVIARRAGLIRNKLFGRL